MEKSPMISVIVPVYNTEDYLETCVKSIVDQTYENLEIILVDDGASDLSGELCDKWAAKDPRIVVVHKKNGGQGQARNQGIELSSGDCIALVDSDDLISENMYDHLLKQMQYNYTDVVGCEYQMFWEQPFTGFENGKIEIKRFNNSEAVQSIFCAGYFQDTVWNMLVKGEVVRKVRFDEGTIHEDILWVYRILREAENAVFSSEKLYAYFQRQGSTMNTSYSEKRFDALNALQQRAREIQDDYPELYPLAEKAYAGVTMHHYQNVTRMGQCEEYTRIKKLLHERFCTADLKAVYKVTTAKYKVWYTLFRVWPELTCRIRNLLKIGL